MKRVLLCAWILFVVSTSFVLGAEEPHVWVISVGVGKYIRSLNTLPKAAEGARRMAEVLMDARPLNTEVKILATDSDDEALQPTKANVISAIEELSRSVKPADLVVFYFCGHGIEDNGRQRLLLKDVGLTSPELLEAGSVALTDLRKKFEALPCNGKLFVLDACRESLQSLSLTAGLAEPTPVTKDFLVSGGGWQTRQGTFSGTLFGCGEGEKVYHGKNGSFFNEALVEGLKGAAKNEEGQVTVASLLDFARKRVPDAVRREIGAGKKQEPIAKGNAGSIVLRPALAYIACPAFDGDSGEIFAELVQTRLAASGKLNLVERLRLKQVMKELGLQNSGLTDQGSIANLGKQLNARYVLVGSSKQGPDGKIWLSSRLVMVETGKDVPGVAVSQRALPENSAAALEALADELLAKMSGTVLPSNPPEQVPEKTSKAKPSKGYLGLEPRDLTPEVSAESGAEKGALVRVVYRNSPAALGGIQPGDAITQVGVEPIASAADLKRVVGAIGAGTTIKITVIRGKEEKTLDVTLGELPGYSEAVTPQ